MKSKLLFGLAMLAGTSVISAQYTSSAIASNFIDIGTTGTPLGLAGIDDGGVLAPIGFNFNFFGAPISAINACTNGYLTTGTNLADFTPDCPAPAPATPNGMIAPFFDDLSCVASGDLYVQNFPGASAVTIIQWEDVATFSSSGARLTFQAQLYDNSTIQFQYESLEDLSGGFAVDGSTAFVGVEDADGVLGEVIGCQTPVIAPNSGFLLAPELPFISAPDQVVTGDVFSVTGQADPGTLFAFAYGVNNNGPIGPIPALGGIVLDLPINFFLDNVSLTPPSGDISSNTFTAPAGFNFTKVYWQCVTLNLPISNVKVSNSVCIILRDGVKLTGSIDSVGAADHYEFPASVGDIISVRHCRTDNTGMNMGTLDPYVCLVDPNGFVAAFDDESAGACLVPGPFGASEIVNYVALTPGTWTVVASSFQGLGDEVGTYELELVAPGAFSAALVLDEGPTCPGQFTNPAVKLLGTMTPLQQQGR